MSDERQQLDEESPWWGEHVFRYEEALKWIRPGFHVLDIACGTGFGTALLASAANTNVVGGDISEEAIAECRSAFANQANLQFEVLDATQLPYADNTFDVITSFETIEHTTRYRELLVEFKRVLKPGGVLLLSTPNAWVSSPDGKVTNPYHTQEFKTEELLALLQSYFPKVELKGQAYHRYHQKSAVKKIPRNLERFFQARGIRKFPYSMRNATMKILTGYHVHPQSQDFSLVSDSDAIRNCVTLFAVCHG